jgi:hypothetical protein
MQAEINGINENSATLLLPVCRRPLLTCGLGQEVVHYYYDIRSRSTEAARNTVTP